MKLGPLGESPKTDMVREQQVRNAKHSIQPLEPKVFCMRTFKIFPETVVVLPRPGTTV